MDKIAGPIHLSREEIAAAVGGVPPEFRNSPQFVHDGLARLLSGRAVIVKVECVNPLGSFKGRGAWVAMQELWSNGTLGLYDGIVTASTGNFGAAVAYAGRALNVPTTILVPPNANEAKRSRLLGLGAQLLEFPDGRAVLAEYAEDHRLYPLTDGIDKNVAVGAGTIAVELTRAIDEGELPAVAAVYLPVGDAALITGVGSWFHGTDVRVVGAVSAEAPSMAHSFKAKRPVSTAEATTYADGISIRVPHEAAVARMLPVVDSFRIVSETQLRAAQLELSSELGITVEGAAAAGWAALRAEADPPAPVALVVTGANVRPTELRWMPLEHVKARL